MTATITHLPVIPASEDTGEMEIRRVFFDAGRAYERAAIYGTCPARPRRPRRPRPAVTGSRPAHLRAV